MVNAVWSWIGVGPYGAHHTLAGLVTSILIGVVIRPQLVTTFSQDLLSHDPDNNTNQDTGNNTSQGVVSSIRAHTTPATDCINHRRGASCPVSNNICNRQDNIYKATISTNSPSQDQYNYIGMCAPQLRLRVATNQQSFKDINQTVLSTKVKQM